MSNLKSIQLGILYRKVSKWWLFFIILLQPIHNKIIAQLEPVSSHLSKAVSMVDELTIILFTVAAIVEYRKKRYDINIHFIYIIPLILFVIAGCISGLYINDNSLIATGHALFLYVRNIFCILIYSAFFREKTDFNKVFKSIVILTLVLIGIAFLEEFWALVSKYHLIDGAYYYPSAFREDRWRLGIFRTSSLMRHYNLFGLYNLIVLIVYINYTRRPKRVILICLILGASLSMSRSVYAGLFLVLMYQVIKSRKKIFIIFLILIAGMLMYAISPYSDFDFTGHKKRNDVLSYREYTCNKSMEIFGDHPYWGVGPAMFGWGMARKYNSQFYEEYNFITGEHGQHIDQLWPQLMVETGVIGTIFFFNMFFISLGIIFVKCRSIVKEAKNKELFTGFIISLLAIFAYTFTSNLEIAPVLYPYFAIIGIAIGNVKQDMNDFETNNV